MLVMSGERTTYSKDVYDLLIVDDDDVIREGLVGYLENYHEAPYRLQIDSSASPNEARQKLAAKQYDLIISDINMPGEDGFSLLRYVRSIQPDTKTALITAYKVEDYIRNAKQTGVFNIIAKTAPFNFDELSNVVNNLLNPRSAFGLETYMDSGVSLQSFTIINSDQIMDVFGKLQAFLEEYKIENAPDLLTAVIEAITNAVYHVAKLPDGSLKYEKGQRIEKLEENEHVTIKFGCDQDRLGIAIIDQGGRITAEEILYWLDRNISGAGLMDTHGRGVYLIHTLVDRVLVNIALGELTEIIMLNYFTSDFKVNKPVYINQL